MRAIHVVHALPPERRRRDWLKYGVYVAVINGLWASAFLGRSVAAMVLGCVALMGALEIHRVVRRAAPVAAIALVLFSAALLSILGWRTLAWRDHFAFVVMVTATVDGFGELTGRLVGHRRLCPGLSPGKTVEGLAGGLTMALGVAVSLGFLTPWNDTGTLAFVGLATAVGAVAGDLTFSAIKRRAGVKDFSGLVPGHGGVLDRFDSLLVATPTFVLARLVLAG